MLDDKRRKVRAQTASAPYIVDYLCGDCKAHHDTVRALLARMDIPFDDAPRLVRGLDYDNAQHLNEFDHALLGAQSGIGGGGRYDGLSEDIGGPPLRHRLRGRPDRIVLAIESERDAPDTTVNRASDARSSACRSARTRKPMSSA